VRAAEFRLISTLLVGIVLIAAATYWMVLRVEGVTPANVGRGAIIVLGVAGCLSLGFFGLHRDWADYRRELDQCIDELQNQRKHLEIKLRLVDAERRQAEALIHGISDAVLVTNAWDELITANPAAEELLGFQTVVALRRPISLVSAAQGILPQITATRAGSTGSQSFALTLTRAGKPRSFAVTMTCVTDSHGAFDSLVTVLHDTTREQEISRMKSDFVAHVSHELRTPLSSIKAYAEMLVDDEAGDDKNKREFYQIIENEADRLSRLIDNILNIGRIESGVTRVQKKLVDLNQVVAAALEVLKPAVREKNLTLVAAVAPALPRVFVDRDMIYQAVLNLLGNALKYTPAGGTVRVATALDKDACVVTLLVEDTGVGIPPEAMPHLFEKFYRVEQHKAMARGSGLGLNLTRQIVEEVHKGRMYVSSVVGQGSTFGFHLPIRH